jgi:hypothetical protein
MSERLLSLLPSGVAAALFSVGCAARSPAPAQVAASEPASKTPAPLVVAYEVHDRAAGALLSGKSDLSMAPLVASTDNRDTKSKASLKLRGHREKDGSISVDAAYEERAPATTIEWSPSVRVGPHSHTVVELRGPGWTRAIELTTE